MSSPPSLQEYFDAREEMSMATTNTTPEDNSISLNTSNTNTREDRSVTGVASVTPAEPIEDDHDSVLNASHIPTIRLSSLGTSLEKDFRTVQQDLACVINESSESAESSNFFDEGVPDVETGPFFIKNSSSNSSDEDRRNQALKVQEVPDHSNPASPYSSQEIVVEDQQQVVQGPLRSNRQRLVSRDGVIAEFDINGGATTNSNENSSDEDDKIVAEAVQIDASFRSGSMRSLGDLELGDEEPLPYPGRRSSTPTRRSPTPGSDFAYYRRASSSARLMGSVVGRYGRAELLSATVIKNSPTEQVGLNLMRDETVVYSITRGEEDDGASLLQHCPFQPGDRLLSINNKRTQHMDSAEVARMLREATGFVNIVVHNPSGDPCLIETMITKANKNQRSGMGLKSTGARDLRVSSINENGLFAQSLLNVGDRILSINEVDVTEVDARVACDIIKNAPDRVTVVARTAHTTGVVVAEVSTRGLRNSTAEPVLTVVPESPGNSNEIEAFDDTFQLTKQQREQLLMGMCLILVVVAVMAGVFGRNSSDAAPN